MKLERAFQIERGRQKDLNISNARNLQNCFTIKKRNLEKIKISTKKFVLNLEIAEYHYYNDNRLI